MKATLEFDLDSTSDRNAHKRSVNATNAYLVLYDFIHYLRQRVKYEEMPEGYHTALVEVRGELHLIMDGHSISLDDLE